MLRLPRAGRRGPGRGPPWAPASVPRGPSPGGRPCPPRPRWRPRLPPPGLRSAGRLGSGARRGRPGGRRGLPAARAATLPFARSYRVEHGRLAGLAGHILGGAHPGDRLVLAAVRTLRDQLEAAQTVHAAEASRQLGRPQPWLAARRAFRSLQHRLIALLMILVPKPIYLNHPFSSG